MVRLKLTVGVTVCLLLASSVFAGMPSRLHELAQVADGGNDALWMKTSFLILNQNMMEDAVVTLRFYDDDGNPLSLNIAGSNSSTYQVLVPAEGSIKLATGGRGSSLRVGSATISANIEVGAQAFFEIYTGDTLITQAAIEPMGPMSSIDIFVDYDVSNGLTPDSPRTGYAVANLSATTPVDIGIWLYPEDGTGAISSYSFQLPPRGHLASYLDQNFPAQFRGTARITSGGSISVTALQAKGFLIGTLPPIRRPLYSRYGGQ